MKPVFLKGIAIAFITTLVVCGYSKASGIKSLAAVPDTLYKNDTVSVTDKEVDSELDRRIAYFASIFGSIEKVEEYYGKPVAQLKKDFRNDVKKELIAAKTKSLNTGTK